MKKQYIDFAYLYDRLMEDVDYNNWSNYIEELLPNIKKSKRLLELACGTGNLTLPLMEKGYDVIGIDISEDMLTVAKDKLLQQGYDTLFIQQDMINLELNEVFDIVICGCDGINYITDLDDLLKLFRTVIGHLSEDGAFLFDISSEYKLRHIIGNNTFGENQGDLCYLWENYFDEEKRLVEMDLTFFLQEGDFYRKYEEHHIQRAYSQEEIISALKIAGFSGITVYGDFQKSSPQMRAERLFFLATNS